MIVARVFRMDRPGITVRKSRIYLGGSFGASTDIPVSGSIDSWWTRLFGQRVLKLGVHRQRALEVLDDNDERTVTHALVFVDPLVDFLFSIEPVVQRSPVIEVLWERRDAQLLLAPVDSEFSVSIAGVWSPSIGEVGQASGPLYVSRRVLFYRVGQNGVVYHDR